MPIRKKTETTLEKKLLTIRQEMGEDIVVSILISDNGIFDIQHVTKNKLFEIPEGDGESGGSEELVRDYPKINTPRHDTRITYFG